MSVIVSGAGIAGVATAHRLATKYGLKNVTVVDRFSPLSMTSAVSTECFRNVWSNRKMSELANLSIDILENLSKQSDNYFNMSHRGYVYVTKSKELANDFQDLADSSSDFDAYVGKDKCLGRFPFVSSESVGALHAKRAGWLDAQQLGQYMIQEAKEAGVKFTLGDITRVDAFESHVKVQIDKKTNLEASYFVNASGPWTNAMNERIFDCRKDLKHSLSPLPLQNELHAKIILHDELGLIPRDIPMIICADEIELPWDDETREFLRETKPKYLQRLPSGLHLRPSSTDGYVFTLWDFVHQHVVISDPPPHTLEPHMYDEWYVEIVLRGLAYSIAEPLQSMIQQGHFGKNTTVDGGFYTQTPDNTPLIGRVQKDLKTVLTISGLSGYGIMMSCGAADLLCCEIVSSDNDNDDTRRMMKSHRVLLESFRPSRDFSQTSSSCDGSNDDVPHALKIIGGSI